MRYHQGVTETRAPARSGFGGGLSGGGAAGGPRGTGRGQDREARLKTLNEKWREFAGQYGTARARNDQEVMTNLRGLMLLIKREIRRLGGPLPEFPADENHLTDL